MEIGDNPWSSAITLATYYLISDEDMRSIIYVVVGYVGTYRPTLLWVLYLVI